MANVTRYKTSKGETRYRVRYRKPDGAQTDKRGFKRKIDAENWAAEHVTIAKATNSYVDPEGGKRLVGDLYEQWLKEKWPTPHDLRHTAASLAVHAGANVKALQRMLGHKNASMTLDVYADLFDSDLMDVARLLDAAVQVETGVEECGQNVGKNILEPV